MGHVMEKIMADVYVRWLRLGGHQVRFQVGTDEHGSKMEQTAKKEGMTPRELVDRNVQTFTSLYDRLGISYDVFIRTTDKKTHWPTVNALWRKLRDAGMLQKRTYTGLYCSGCERFLTKKELVDGLCPDHLRAPEEVSEENWFYALKKDADFLTDLLKNETLQIIPSSRSHEVLSLLERGLEDASFSRPTSSVAWGIPVPDDEGQTMYVWCDALTNYISGLGYFTDHEQKEWWESATITHVIGKDIARFHALLWPSMLKTAGIKTPEQILMHGFITSDGQKMSKSLGNVVNPVEVVEKYGVDALRFFLSHEIPVGNDGDFSWKRFSEIYQSKLGNQLGNLMNRVLTLMIKGNIEISPDMPHPTDMDKTITAKWKHYSGFFDSFSLSEAVQQAMDIVTFCNQMMQTHEVWNHERKNEFLSEFCESLRHIALMLLPFIPDSAQKMSKQLGAPYAESMLNRDFVITKELQTWGGCTDWTHVGTPEILFPKVD